MPSKGSGAPNSPSTSSFVPSQPHSRRPSNSSVSAKPTVDKQALSQALDHIHDEASQSDTLTTFDDYARPRPGSRGEGKGFAADVVQGGLSGLYSRIKATVGGAVSTASGQGTPAESLAINSAVGRYKSGSSAALLSPTTASSSTQAQSPLAAQSSPYLRSQSGGVSANSPHLNASSARPGSSTTNGSNEHNMRLPIHHESTHEVSLRPAPPLNAMSGSSLLAFNHAPAVEASRAARHNASVLSSTQTLPLQRQHSDIGSILTDISSVHDDDQTLRAISSSVRPSFMLEGNSYVSQSSRSVASKGEEEASLEYEEAHTTLEPAISNATERPPERPPMVHVGASHLPGFRVSRTNSSDGESSSLATTRTRIRRPHFETVDEHAASRSSGQHPPRYTNVQKQKNRVLARELWMRDENARDCFYCGDSFSAFRRKHHCRICGNVFDAKCTVFVPGKYFGQSGQLRTCKPCEGMVYGTDDDSSEYTDDDRASTSGRSFSSRSATNFDQFKALPQISTNMTYSIDDHLDIGTPSMAVPMSRKTGNEAKRRSTVIEENQHSLARPSSSRSLRSLSGRPRTGGHKRHNSRHTHQHMKSLKSDQERVPFQRGDAENSRSGSLLPAFHHDNIIDPDLAPFLSDEGSSEDDTNIFTTMNAEPQSPGKVETDRAGLSSLLASVRRGMGSSTIGNARSEADNLSVAGRARNGRKRNFSISSVQNVRASPRRTKSNSLLKIPFGYPQLGAGTSPRPLSAPMNESKMMRSSAMRGASAPAVELNQASLQHVRRLLRQFLQDHSVSEVKRWEKALMPILLQCTDDVNPDIHRNDDIDVRHYIKLKKIPGGKPGDTSYVSGVVFSKNLSLKSMPRSISNPRIAILSFPLEYARHHKHFMSLEPVIAQEREYLRNLVKRIANVGVQLLLVEKNVAGLALDFLEQAGIAVVANVKPSVLNAVARCTQTRIITSPEKLSIDPSHLGTCGSFDVKTYVYGTMKKTFTYLSGCQKDLGCTIVLRGADFYHLRKLKRITEFMCYVVYNLKLETCVMRDEYVLIPATLPSGTINSGQQPKELNQGDALKATEERKSERASLEKKSTVAVESQSEESTSPVCDDSISRSVSDELLAENEKLLDSLVTSRSPSTSTAYVEKHKFKIISASPFVHFVPPYLLAQARQQEAQLAELKQMRDKYAAVEDEKYGESQNSGKFELVRPDMVHGLVQQPTRQVRDFLYAVHNARYEKALHAYLTQKRQWESYLHGNATLLDPFNHQRIAVLYSMVNTKTSNPCVGPDVIALSFYNEHDLDDGFLPDITLGQYVEDLCLSAETLCVANGCEESMFNHHRQYVHGEGQMSVLLQHFPARLRGMHNTILMWSACRKCGQETQVIPMSENTWKFSFGKYLELTFWSTPLHPRANVCPHDIHRDHVRYFGFHNVAIRVQYDAIELNEIIVPRPTITWNVDKDLQLKNEQFLRFKGRLDRFMATVKHRIDGIRVESVTPEKVVDAKFELERLGKKVQEDHDALTISLQNRYMNSRYYELIPLNKAAKEMHENSIEWDEVFLEFEKNYFPSEKDIRRLAQIQINRFLDRDASTASISSIEEGVESVVAELNDTETTDATIPSLGRRISTLSPEDTHHVLASVIKDNQMGKDQPEVLPAPQIEEAQVSAEPLTAAGAADRDDVKHLDLAVPPDLASSSLLLSTKESLPSPTMFGMSPDKPPTIIPETEDLQLSLQVTETVQRMREAARKTEEPEDNSSHLQQQETKIPRPVVTSTRSDLASHTASPPLMRAKSSPQAQLPVRRQPIFDQSNSSSTTNISTNSKSERLKNFITDPARALERRMGPSAFRSARSVSRSLIPRSVPSQRNESKVLTLRQHFEQLSKEFEKQRMRERQQRVAQGGQQRAYPFASSKPIVEVYRDAQEAVQEHDSGDEAEPEVSSARASFESSGAGTLVDTAGSREQQKFDAPTEEIGTSRPTSPDKEDDTSPSSSTSLPRASDDTAEGSDTEPASVEDIETIETGVDALPLSPSDSSIDLQELKHEKTSLLKMLTSFWSERSASGWSPLEYPFHANEHVWGDSDIIVREDEPSSLIALALSSADYKAKEAKFRGHGDEFSENGVDQSIEHNLLHPKNTNIRYAFQNRGVRAHTKIFYAESFDALRRKTGVADRFVESLSRCLKWDSKGGKTKSIFLKTLDDRFVLKSLSQVEVNAFFKFAPNYFAFMHQNLFHSLPSVIAKMMGLFQVTIRAPGTGLEFNWFMLVMENLFYDRMPNRRFDLKGSMRNRKIQSTGEQDEVLLDENFVDLIFEKPIFVREHTWRMLKASVWNDTLFLSKQNVMDYSLMAGFDDDAKEIIVGIIDCIRTYTWDKKLETWIKDRGKNKPTVTSPKDYRNRFRIAMSKYILQAPNCWHQFQAQQAHTAQRQPRLPEPMGDAKARAAQGEDTAIRPGEEMWA